MIDQAQVRRQAQVDAVGLAGKAQGADLLVFLPVVEGVDVTAVGQAFDLDAITRAANGGNIYYRCYATRDGAIAIGALSASLRAKVPAVEPAGTWPTREHARKVLMLVGCVQPAMAPNINAATARVLDRLGIALVEAAGRARNPGFLHLATLTAGDACPA